MDYNFRKIKLHTEGDSHSERIDVRIEGLPADSSFDKAELQAFMDRRHGDGSELAKLCSTSRKESDIAIFDSDLKDMGLIRAHIDNKDVRSADYDKLRTVLRPGHADLGAYLKYGREGLKPGGGEFSGRMTAALCLAGGIAKQLLAQRGVEITAFAVEIGGMPCMYLDDDEELALIARIEDAKKSGDSLGGVVGCRVSGYPGGIGGAGIDGLEGELARAALAIPSAKGIEFGSGFAGATLEGSMNNDEYFLENGRIFTKCNFQGGISGGISTGMNITFDVAFKPVPSISCEQRTVDIEKLEETTISIEGRHDVCVVPRVLPVVEAMAALVLLDRLEAENE